MSGTKSKEKGLKTEEEIPGLSTVLKRLKNRMLVGNLSFDFCNTSYQKALQKSGIMVFYRLEVKGVICHESERD